MITRSATRSFGQRSAPAGTWTPDPLIRTIFAQPTAHAVREQLDTVAVMLGRHAQQVWH